MQNLPKLIFRLVLVSILVFRICIHAETPGVTGTTAGTNALNNCPAQVCTYDDPSGRYVQFPYSILNVSLPSTCGYPGFDLLCNRDDKLLIDLPNSGLFSVKAIDYVKQEIWLNDPNNCLPRRLLKLNLSNFDESPFIPAQNQKQYWLYNCSNEYFTSNNVNIKPISCLSGSRHGVLASPIKITNNYTARMCNYLGNIHLSDGLRPVDLSGDIRLTWAEPRCDECYKKNGRCGFTSYSSLIVGCLDVPPRGLRKQTLVAIALAFAAPLAFFTCCTTYFSIRAICARRRRNNAGITPTTAEILQPQPAVINGLDRSVIESYPKVVLGESRRLPKPDDKSCSICLGEYLAKETLRTLPDCGHCFHAECIDEWLELNASCPVCRNTPSNSLEIT